MTPRDFYQTPEWRAMSRRIRERDEWLCTACKPRTVAAQLVHHVTPLSAGGRGDGPCQPHKLVLRMSPPGPRPGGRRGQEGVGAIYQRNARDFFNLSRLRGETDDDHVRQVPED